MVGLGKIALMLVFLLRLAGCWLLLAWAALLLPEAWMMGMHQSLGLGEWPGGPLTVYLARSVSMLYGFVGLMSLFMSFDAKRYLPLIRFSCWIGLILGPVMFAVGVFSGMPWLWAIVEGICIILFCVLILWAVAKEERKDERNRQSE